MEKFLNVKEMVQLTRLSRSMVYALVANKELPHYRIGNRVLFEENEVNKWLGSKHQVSKPTT